MEPTHQANADNGAISQEPSAYYRITVEANGNIVSEFIHEDAASTADPDDTTSDTSAESHRLCDHCGTSEQDIRWPFRSCTHCKSAHYCTYECVHAAWAAHSPNCVPCMHTILPELIIHDKYLRLSDKKTQLCDLPYVEGKQDMYSQQCLYLLLLLHGTGNWKTTAQTFNYIFRTQVYRTTTVLGTQSDVPSHVIYPEIMEGRLERMFLSQGLYPTDDIGRHAKYAELEGEDRPFHGEGNLEGQRFGVGEVLRLIRELKIEAGIDPDAVEDTPSGP